VEALRAEAEWSPRDGYVPGERETARRRASSGSLVWRNTVVRVVETADPRPAADELILKVRYCGICGSDTHVYESDREGYIIFSGPAKMPCTLGHEFTGDVVEVGRDVRDFRKGDIVTCESVMWCGECLPCRRGMPNQCENVELLGLTSDGAFADYIAVKAGYCWGLNGIEGRYSREDALRIGSLIEPLGCAYNGIFIAGGGFSPGAYAIVYGAGPIGLASVMLLRIAGAGKVIAVDVIRERLSIAEKMGADYVFNAAEAGGLEEAVSDITGGWGADIQVEAAGAARETLPMMQKLYSKRGKIVYLGRAESSGTVDLNGIVSGGHSLIGSRGHSGYGIFPDIIRLIEGGRLDGVMKMITAEFPFSDIIGAFETSRDRKDGKILVKIS
jgi:threonine dehydrogenase-like Zn-dependent dehydrogenase